MTELRYRTISAEELALGDGKEGRPALVAYKGKVYDVTPSKLWRNGKHVNAHLAGRDLTVEMGAAPHMEDVMNSFPVIGLYPDPTAQAAEASDGPAATSTSSSPDASAQSGPGDQSARDSASAGADREPAAFISWLLSHHPHPVSVHWPIALGVVAAMLTLLELLWPLLPFSQFSPDATDGPLKVSWRYLLQQASLVNVLICALFSGPAIWTGWLSWVHNYRSKDSALFRAKIAWSWVLGAVLLVLLFVRFAMPFAGQLDGGLWYWVYSLLVISLAPIVILLGWYGGKITFPSA
ncbi:hypothetical protein IT575_07930 [bacterium]|nr:hypothetical protein [bacterium]